MLVQLCDGRERIAARTACHVARSSTPGSALTPRHPLDRSFERLAGRPAEEDGPVKSHEPLLPALDELGRRRVDVVGVRGAHEVLAALDDAKLGAAAVDEEVTL